MGAQMFQGGWSDALLGTQPLVVVVGAIQPGMGHTEQQSHQRDALVWANSEVANSLGVSEDLFKAH
jgi:hypothetical protein